jgi:hypothetical protein
MGLPTPKTAATNYRKRTKRTVAAAKRWGFAPKESKDGKISFVSRPGITSLIRSLLPQMSAENPAMSVGEQTSAALSARAHGTLWSLVAGATPVTRIGAHRQLGVIDLDVLELVRLLGLCVLLHDQAVSDVASLAGVDPVRWQADRGQLPWFQPSRL